MLSVNLGKTEYKLRRSLSPGILEIVRCNQAGETIFHVPESLFKAYLKMSLVDLIERMF